MKTFFSLLHARPCLAGMFLALCTVLVAQPGGNPSREARESFRNMYDRGGYQGRPATSDPNRANRAQQEASVKQKRINLTGTFKLSGTLVDSATREPLDYVNVTLLTVSDSQFVKGAISDEKGRFTISMLPEGEYLFRASYVGYKLCFRKILVNGVVQMGEIKMQPSSTSLGEVVVTAERPIYSVDGEKTVYNVSEDPSIQTGTTSDALQNAPGVEVDIEGNITLRGISSVEIWIDDKPSKLTAENLKTYLEMLPANALERIETITNPSSKYATDAEAVINIVTSAHVKRNHFVSFGLNASSQPNVSPWVSYVIANDKWSLNLYESFRYSYRENASEGYSIQRRDNAAHDGYDTTQRLDNTSRSENTSLSNYFSANVGYVIDSMSEISLSGSFNYSKSMSNSSSTSERDQSYVGGQNYSYTTDNDNDSRNLLGMLFATYSRKFDNKGHNLRIFANGSISSSDGNSYYLRDYSTIYNDLDQNKYYRSEGNSSSYGLNARYNYPYNKIGTLSCGLNYNYSHSRSFYDPLSYDSAVSDYVIQDPLRRRETSNSGHSAGTDVNWSLRWQRWTLQLGMGVGLRQTGICYINDVYPDDTTFRFLTYNPSVHLSYRTKSMHTVKASYTLRMSTPDATQLTTFRSYGEDSYSVGNRHLTPYYIHNAEAGWTKYFNRFGSVGVDAYGRFSTHEISSITDVTEEEDPYIGRIIDYSMPYNMGSTYRYGGSFNATYSPNAFFNLRFYANLYHSVYDMDYPKMGQNVHSEKTSYSLRLNAWAKIFDRYQIHASARYSSPTKTLFYESKANYSINCGIRSDFFDRKMSVFVNVQDIFNWGKKVGSSGVSTNPYYLSYSNSKVLNSRYISAGLTFRFGKLELENKSTSGAIGEE